MKCPKCGADDNFKVLRIIKADKGNARLYECLGCGYRVIETEVDLIELIREIVKALVEIKENVL